MATCAGKPSREKDMRECGSTDLSAYGDLSFQTPKDLEVGLRVVRDEFFSILPKILDWESVLDTLEML